MPTATPADPNTAVTGVTDLFGNPLSSWSANPTASGVSKDAANWYRNQGFTWTPMGWKAPLAGPYAGMDFAGAGLPFGTESFSTGSMYGTPGAYPNRALPSWMSPMGKVTGESEQAFRDIPGLFNTGPYRQAVDETLGRVSTTARNAATNAAAEYANKMRQAGGTGAASGLVKALGMVGAEKTVGDVRTQAAQYILDQQEKQATLSGQIANNLGNLRNQYLSTLAGYATSEDRFSASLGAGRGGAGGGAGGGGGGSGNNWTAIIPNQMGLASGLRPFAANMGQGVVSTSTNPMAGTPWMPQYFGGG